VRSRAGPLPRPPTAEGPPPPPPDECPLPASDSRPAPPRPSRSTDEESGDAGHTYRGLFIISDKGVLRHITVNDFPVGRSVDEVLRLVKAFQFTDENGVVCPANWKPGAKTMVPDPEKSKAYFEGL